MKLIAVLENNIVIDRILADTVELAELLTGKTCVNFGGKICEIGYLYNPENNKFFSHGLPLPTDPSEISEE